MTQNESHKPNHYQSLVNNTENSGYTSEYPPHIQREALHMNKSLVSQLTRVQDTIRAFVGPQHTSILDRAVTVVESSAINNTHNRRDAGKLGLSGFVDFLMQHTIEGNVRATMHPVTPHWINSRTKGYETVYAILACPQVVTERAQVLGQIDKLAGYRAHGVSERVAFPIARISGLVSSRRRELDRRLTTLLMPTTEEREVILGPAMPVPDLNLSPVRQ